MHGFRVTTARQRCLAVAISALAFLLPLEAGAASLSVEPVRVELTPDARSAAITVHNDGDAPVVVRARITKWSQVDGKDKLDDTREFLVTPPLVEIAPHGLQVLRLARRQAATDVASEQTYRVIVKEVLPEAEAKAAGLHMALELSLPVFIEPKGLAGPKLEWQAWRETGQIRMLAKNSGARRARVSQVEVLDKNGQKLGDWSGVTYLLTGTSRSYVFKVPKLAAHAGTQVKLRVTTEAGTDELVTTVVDAGN